MVTQYIMKIIEENKVISIDEIYPNEYNPKPDFNSTEELKLEFEKIKKSIKFHGQGDPIKVRETAKGYEIIDGYHRWFAMKELGYDKAEIKSFGKITREQAIKITLSFERTKIPLDVIEEAKLVKEIYELEQSIDGLPYTEEEVADKIKLLEFDFDQYEDDMDNDGEKKEKEVTCPNCNHKFII